MTWQRQRAIAAADDATAREDGETAERSEWAGTVADIIIDATLPAATSASVLRDLLRACSSRRAVTLRMQVRHWVRFRTWIVDVTGRSWPSHPSLIIEYLEELADDITRSMSLPSQLLTTTIFFVKEGPAVLHFRHHCPGALRGLWRNCMDPPHQDLVINAVGQRHWFRHQHPRPGFKGFSVTLLRTKVSRLKTGFLFWTSPAFGFEQDYFVPGPSAAFQSVIKRMANASVMAAHGYIVRACLRCSPDVHGSDAPLLDHDAHALDRPLPVSGRVHGIRACVH